MLYPTKFASQELFNFLRFHEKAQRVILGRYHPRIGVLLGM